MKFDLDEQQRGFQQAATDYLAAECPMTRALAPHDHGRADLGVWKGLMALGIGGIVVPQEHGGLGLGLLDLAVVAEVVGRYAAPGPFTEHALATLAIVLAGSDAQRLRWLPALASGEVLGTVAFAEGKGCWLPEHWTVSADGGLLGRKDYVLHGAEAGLAVVGLAGGRLGLVELPSAGTTVTPVACTDGGKQMATLMFDGAECDPLPGDAARALLDAGLVLSAADAFGGASHCVAASVEYAKLREQFGQPIGMFQAVKHQLADMALMVEPNVGLYWYAAHAFDTDPAAAPLAAALAKSLLCENYPQVARRMIEAHGGIGYTWEFGAHVWLKRALFNQAWMGTPRQHRARAAQLAGW